MARCGLCNSLEKKEEHDVRAAFDFAPKQLLESATIEECVSCFLILEGIYRFEDETWSFEEDVRRVYAQSLTAADESLYLDIYFMNDRPKLALEFFCVDRETRGPPGRPFAAIKPGGSISGHPLSRSGLQWVNSLLGSCVEEHTSCPSNRKVVLPRRVLAFNREGDGSITVQIQESYNLEGRYIALSHCWGSTQTCITTSQNLLERKRSIPWVALPKTFQDSIIYSLQLGVHYLWVDALCILQDNPDDWQIESAKMGDIYRNSFLTLAATASKNGQGGCFSSYDDRVLPKEYELDSCQSAGTSIMVREKIQHWIIPPSAATLEHHPLLTRGWTFQERLLSPRVLHFCGGEMVWECQSQTVCECHGDAAKSNPTNQFSQSLQSLLSGQNSSTVRSQSRDLRPGTPSRNSAPGNRLTLGDPALSELWHRIVEQYSALNLTKETDRLPALSGLAQRASSVLGNYVAGLWSKTLVSNLMWRVNKLDMKHGRPSKHNGASWSWVSVTGTVSYWSDLEVDKYLEEVNSVHNEESATRSSMIKMALLRAGTIQRSSFTFLPVGHHVVSASKDPFGSISSATLVLVRYLQPAILKYVYTRQGIGSGSGYGRREVDKLKYEIQIGFIELPFFADYVLCEEGKYHIEEHHQLYMMVVHPDVCLVLRKTASALDLWMGALLSNEKDLLVSTYERVGIVKQPRAFLDTYLLDWMPGGREELVMIN